MVSSIRETGAGREDTAVPAAAPPSPDAATSPALATAVAQVLQHAAELSEVGAHDVALVVLDRALSSDPHDAELHAARGWALENLGHARLADARAAYETAVGLDPRQLWAWIGLATVLGKLGLTSRCPAIYRDLVERAALRVTQEPEFFELLGWCQYRLGQLDAAAETFQRALAIDDAWVSVRFDLALVLLLRGDADAAQQQYRRGLHCLAERDPAMRKGPLKVALDDLDDALKQHPSLHVMIASTGLREELERAARAGGPGHG